MYCYIIHERLLEHLGTHEEKQEMAKHLELLARIFLNHDHPHRATLTGKTVDPKDASLLVLVTNFKFDLPNDVLPHLHTQCVKLAIQHIFNANAECR